MPAASAFSSAMVNCPTPAPKRSSRCITASPSSRVTFDYQFVANPAYNRDRGPVSIIGTRLHTQF
jgi:high affinity Mn2+ porin